MPDLLYASFVSSEALAYPLVLLVSVYAAIRALRTPSRRTQVVFVALAVLATSPASSSRCCRSCSCWRPFSSAPASGARRRRFASRLLALGVFAVAAARCSRRACHTASASTAGCFGFHAGPLGIVHWAALDAMTLAYAAGWIIVPGALLGLWLTLARPRSTDELAFGVVARAARRGAASSRPACCRRVSTSARRSRSATSSTRSRCSGSVFALYASRGWPLALPHLALAAALVLVSVRLPLSGYAVASTVDGSPILFGVYWLTGKLGQAGRRRQW